MVRATAFWIDLRALKRRLQHWRLGDSREHFLELIAHLVEKQLIIITRTSLKFLPNLMLCIINAPEFHNRDLDGRVHYSGRGSG